MKRATEVMGEDTSGHSPGGGAGENRRLGVDVVVRSDRWVPAGIDTELLETAMGRALEAAGWPAEATAEVALVLSSDDEVRRLNATWRQRDEATNVLSFPTDQPGPDDQQPQPLGDIVLAYETVLAEARAKGATLSAHCAYLAIHGLLHLLGHDHQTDEDARAMEDLERRVLGNLGIADPYDCQPDKAHESALTAGE